MALTKPVKREEQGRYHGVAPVSFFEATTRSALNLRHGITWVNKDCQCMPTTHFSRKIGANLLFPTFPYLKSDKT